MNALQAALARHSRPEIINTDPWRPVHQHSLHGCSLKAGIFIGMADKRAWPDNVFVKRLWRSVKYEKVAKGLRDFHVSIGRYKRFYNTGTAYSSFDRKTADQA